MEQASGKMGAGDEGGEWSRVEVLGGEVKMGGSGLSLTEARGEGRAAVTASTTQSDRCKPQGRMGGKRASFFLDASSSGPDLFKTVRPVISLVGAKTREGFSKF